MIGNMNDPSCSVKKVFETRLGEIYCGDSSVLLKSILEKESIDLILTSPPYGLLRKKSYGSEDADLYVVL